MTQYIILMSIGPVQGMITSARRSRDLWSSSFLLSEVAKACAKSLKNAGADLIFPFISHEKALDKNSEFSVGNKVQAIVTAETAEQVKTIVENAKQATEQRFLEEAQLALMTLNNTIDIRMNVWERQMNDYLEIQAVWVQIHDDYTLAVQQAGAALASRKATRDFNPSATTPFEPSLRLPKSSLDGARETVIKETDDNNKPRKILNQTRLKLGLSPSEQLDCIGVVKRLGFDEKAEQFTPFTRVSVDSWIQDILDKDIHAFEDVNTFYEALVQKQLATRVTGNQQIYQAMPFDGQLLYRSRLEVAIADNKHDSDISEALQDFKLAVKPLCTKYGEPCPYGVLLLADGDKMGELLDKAYDKNDHQAITHALSNFAQNVAETMRNHRGHCIYAGGDDVLGFVPLDKAYACADDLRQRFLTALQPVADKLHAKPPTLSVGLAITHIMTPLGIIRELADVAEKHAKGDHVVVDKRRNALGILLNVRGGNETKLRLGWDDTEAHKALKDWIELYTNKTIPSRLAYDTRAIYLRTKEIAKADETLNRKIQNAEFIRMLEQARTTTGKKIDESICKALETRASHIGLSNLADEMIVARWLALKTQKDLGKE